MYPSIVPEVLPVIGEPNWYYLCLLSPYAGVYYWRSGARGMGAVGPPGARGGPGTVPLNRTRARACASAKAHTT